MTEVLASDDAIGRQVNDGGREMRETAVAALAQAPDARIAVLTGDAGQFTEFAELMPDPSLGQGVTSPRTISDLIESLEYIGRGSTSRNSDRSDLDA
ncbi:hypothetical protein DBZ45_10760 [Arthrobacter globiformis]|uniref:Uncharacterized protein n=2 Tax=Arthrobacter globiformis TaxID=1665 RepID=A0A328HFF2_ARTGO|nr:hypothetical protein DBZ45_10760 [Arthrobacter globiformis]